MRLIDADAIVLPNDLPYKESVRQVIAQAPTVENAVVLPVKIGTDLWYVDEEDGYKVKCYNHPQERVYGIAVFENKMEIIGFDGMTFPIGESWSCISKEQAEEVRKKILSDLPDLNTTDN